MTNRFRQDFLHGSDLKLGLLAVAEVSGWADLAEILWRSGLFWLPVQDWYHRDDDPVKTPAVKPCIAYIIVLLCSVGSKELSAYRL